MLNASALLRLAYKAYLKGAEEDAYALATLAFSATDAKDTFEAGIPSPVPVDPIKEAAKSEKAAGTDPDKSPSTFTSLLENGDVQNPTSNPSVDQTGFTVKGNLYQDLRNLAAFLEKSGHPELAISINDCIG